jgi:hypothetical protein
MRRCDIAVSRCRGVLGCCPTERQGPDAGVRVSEPSGMRGRTGFCLDALLPGTQPIPLFQPYFTRFWYNPAQRLPLLRTGAPAHRRFKQAALPQALALGARGVGGGHRHARRGRPSARKARTQRRNSAAAQVLRGALTLLGDDAERPWRGVQPPFFSLQSGPSRCIFCRCVGFALWCGGPTNPHCLAEESPRTAYWLARTQGTLSAHNAIAS